MSGWYCLAPDGVTPVAIEGDIRWKVRWFEDSLSRVVDSTRINNIRISTVFLSIDHGWNIEDRDDYEPVLWETMIFGGVHDQYQERYTSYHDARLGHEVAVKMAREGLTWEAKAEFMCVRLARQVNGGLRRLRHLPRKVFGFLWEGHWQDPAWWWRSKRNSSKIISIKRK